MYSINIKMKKPNQTKPNSVSAFLASKKTKFVLKTLKIFSIISIIIHLIITIGSTYIFSTYFLTIAMYFTFGWFLIWIIDKSKINKNLKITVILLFSGLFFIDSKLRFYDKRGLNYSEKNGQLYYNGRKPIHNLWNGKCYNTQCHKKNSLELEKKIEFSYAKTFNNLGLRGDSISQKNKNEFRILALGDSFTEGVGTPDDSTWCVLLEENLKKLNLSTKINVINGGRSGSDPAICLYSLQKELANLLKPNMIILAINNSDVTDFVDRGGYERYNIGLKTNPWWEFFYGFSFIFRVFILDILHYNTSFVKNEDIDRKYLEAFPKLVETINSMKFFCERNNIKFVLTIMPHQYELEGNYLNNGLVYCYNELITTTHIIFLPDYYQKKIAETNTYPFQYYWHLDYHHNSIGYKMMADGICEGLLSNPELLRIK